MASYMSRSLCPNSYPLYPQDYYPQIHKNLNKYSVHTGYQLPQSSLRHFVSVYQQAFIRQSWSWSSRWTKRSRGWHKRLFPRLSGCWGHRHSPRRLRSRRWSKLWPEIPRLSKQNWAWSKCTSRRRSWDPTLLLYSPRLRPRLSPAKTTSPGTSCQPSWALQQTNTLRHPIPRCESPPALGFDSYYPSPGRSATALQTQKTMRMATQSVFAMVVKLAGGGRRSTFIGMCRALELWGNCEICHDLVMLRKRSSLGTGFRMGRWRVIGRNSVTDSNLVERTGSLCHVFNMSTLGGLCVWSTTVWQNAPSRQSLTHDNDLTPRQCVKCSCDSSNS